MDRERSVAPRGASVRRHLPLLPGGDARVTVDQDGRGLTVSLGAGVMTLPHVRKRSPHRFDAVVDAMMVGALGPRHEAEDARPAEVVIDCEARLPLCKGACCGRRVLLTRAEAEAGTLRWDFRRPYQLAARADGRCVHQDEGARCAVYAERPLACRRYDCRRDTAIWRDFDARIPAPSLPG